MKPSPLFLHRPPTRNTLLHDGPPPAWDRLKARINVPETKNPAPPRQEKRQELASSLQESAEQMVQPV